MPNIKEYNTRIKAKERGCVKLINGFKDIKNNDISKKVIILN